MSTRWTLSDGVVTYAFQINPNAAENLLPSRDIRWDYNRNKGFSGTRAPRRPVPWSFSGVLRSQAQHDDLLLWLNKRVRLTLTTDLGQTLTVRLTAFKPSQQTGGASALPWRMTYSMSCLISSDEPATQPAPDNFTVAEITAPTLVATADADFVDLTWSA